MADGRHDIECLTHAFSALTLVSGSVFVRFSDEPVEGRTKPARSSWFDKLTTNGKGQKSRSRHTQCLAPTGALIVTSVHVPGVPANVTSTMRRLPLRWTSLAPSTRAEEGRPVMCTRYVVPDRP